jgi:hypothetical protein
MTNERKNCVKIDNVEEKKNIKLNLTIFFAIIFVMKNISFSKILIYNFKTLFLIYNLSYYIYYYI